MSIGDSRVDSSKQTLRLVPVLMFPAGVINFLAH